MNRPRILLAVAKPAQRREVRTILQKEGYDIVGETDDSTEALRMIRTMRLDLVILESDLKGISGLELARIVEEDRLAPILLLVPYWQRQAVEAAYETWIFAFATKPINEATLLPAVETAIMNFEKWVKMDREIEKLKNTIAARKLIERAKGILMDEYGLSENDAYKRIRRQSMNKCIPMAEVAKAIILANDLKNDECK